MDPDILAEIEELRREFVESMLERKREIRHSFERGMADKVRHHTHKIAGSAGSFGFGDISTAAKSIEDKLVSGVFLDELKDGIVELERQINAVTDKYGVAE